MRQNPASPGPFGEALAAAAFPFHPHSPTLALQKRRVFFQKARWFFDHTATTPMCADKMT